MILSCYTANMYGENCCLGCLPGGMTAMRTHMRLTYGIQVSYNCVALWNLSISHKMGDVCDDLTLMKLIFIFLTCWAHPNIEQARNLNCSTFPCEMFAFPVFTFFAIIQPQGTIINDALMTFFCGTFETCRMAREVRIRNGNISM